MTAHTPQARTIESFMELQSRIRERLREQEAQLAQFQQVVIMGENLAEWGRRAMRDGWMRRQALTEMQTMARNACRLLEGMSNQQLPPAA